MSGSNATQTRAGSSVPIATIDLTAKRLRGGKGKLVDVRGKGAIEICTGHANLWVAYDPPGAEWTATAFAAVTLFLCDIAHVTALAGVVVWFISYFIVRQVRAVPGPHVLDAANVEEVVVDADGRVAVRASARPASGWIGMKLESPPSDLVGLLRATWGDKVRQGELSSSDRAAIAVLVVAVVGLIVAVVAALGCSLRHE